MDINDTSAVITALTQAARAGEVWMEHTFSMERESEKHGYQDVTVTILDRGSKFSPRYHVSATTPEGQKCTGNSGDDLAVVIDTVHWYQLDH